MIKIVIRPKRSFLFSISRDVVTIVCLLSLFFSNYHFLGNHWSINLFGGTLIFLTAVARGAILDSREFNTIDNAIKYLKLRKLELEGSK